MRHRLLLLTLLASAIACVAMAICSSALWLGGLFFLAAWAGYRLARGEQAMRGDPLLPSEGELFGRDIAMWWPALPDRPVDADRAAGSAGD